MSGRNQNSGFLFCPQNWSPHDHFCPLVASAQVVPGLSSTLVLLKLETYPWTPARSLGLWYLATVFTASLLAFSAWIPWACRSCNMELEVFDDEALAHLSNLTFIPEISEFGLFSHIELGINYSPIRIFCLTLLLFSGFALIQNLTWLSTSSRKLF